MVALSDLQVAQHEVASAHDLLAILQRHRTPRRRPHGARLGALAQRDPGQHHLPEGVHHLRVVRQQAVEDLGREAQELSVEDRAGGGGSRGAREERHLADGLALPHFADGHHRPARASRKDAQSAVEDEEHRVSRLAFAHQRLTRGQPQPLDLFAERLQRGALHAGKERRQPVEHRLALRPKRVPLDLAPPLEGRLHARGQLGIGGEVRLHRRAREAQELRRRDRLHGGGAWARFQQRELAEEAALVEIAEHLVAPALEAALRAQQAAGHHVHRVAWLALVDHRRSLLHAHVLRGQSDRAQRLRRHIAEQERVAEPRDLLADGDVGHRERIMAPSGRRACDRRSNGSEIGFPPRGL